MSNEPTPKKSLGQHWLYDDASLGEMVSSAKVNNNDTVLEVGPGLGTLTERLLDKSNKVIAVEFDKDLAENLKKSLESPNLDIKNEDILNFNLESLPEGYKVVANIPYYLTSHLIRRICESKPKFSYAVLLVQKEVAERVCASPGHTSLLSITTQYYCEAELGLIVPAHLFTPPPKVDSQILILKRRSKNLFIDVDEAKFFKLVKAGFSERRKKLRSSLSGGLRLSKTETDTILEKAGISKDLRAQALSMNQWHDLYKFIIDKL